MKTYQMPCLRKAASQSRLSTSLTMMKHPTQVYWTVKTVLGMWVFLHVSVYTNLYVLPFQWLCPLIL